VDSSKQLREGKKEKKNNTTGKGYIRPDLLEGSQGGSRKQYGIQAERNWRLCQVGNQSKQLNSVPDNTEQGVMDRRGRCRKARDGGYLVQ